MNVLIAGACRAENIYSLVDPSGFSESEFEDHVRAALRCAYPDYHCIPFRGGFAFDENKHEADLALVHKTYSHWFVLEVELVSHSLRHHVLPQVRSFRFGAPLDSCVTYLCRHLPGVELTQAYSLLNFVPRGVAVIANRQEQEWSNTLQGCDVQFSTVSVFRGVDDALAYSVDGSLSVPRTSLGFFVYSSPNRSVRIPHEASLPEGTVQIEDPYGIVGLWVVRYAEDGAWVTKDVGDPGIPHNSVLQLLMTETGKITMRLPGRRLRGLAGDSD